MATPPSSATSHLQRVDGADALMDLVMGHEPVLVKNRLLDARYGGAHLRHHHDIHRSTPFLTGLPSSSNQTRVGWLCFL